MGLVTVIASNLYIDIHTHNSQPSGDKISILNLDLLSSAQIDRDKLPLFSAGIHPWWIEHFSSPNIAQSLDPWLNHPNCMALGEIGLDACIATDLSRQKAFFREQLLYAKSKSLKVIVLHCVRLYNEVMATIKEVKYEGPIVLHDYNGSLQDSKQLSKKPQFYFSFGKRLFDVKSKAVRSLAELPLERVFLETDDQLAYGIKDIYLQAEKILDITDEKLREAIALNFSSIFPTQTRHE